MALEAQNGSTGPVEANRRRSYVFDPEIKARGKVVLVVDDSVVMRHMVARVVEGMGYEPVGAADGVEAVALASYYEPELIVLDLLMPGKNGWQVLQELRAQKRFQTVPIVLLTVETYRHSVEKAILTGASDYLTKPIPTEALKERLRRFLE